MTSISSVSSAWSNTYAQRSSAQPQPGRLSQRLQTKFDQDQSGGIDATELEGLLSDVAKKTGTSSTTSAAELLASNDANGDGSLSGNELESTLKRILPPPPSTMEFAQSRGMSTDTATSQENNDLFGKVDTNGDGSVSQDELQGLLEKMSGGTASKTGVSSNEVFSKLDTDSNGSLTQAEFEAGRSSGGQNQVAGGKPPGGMPPPPGGMPPPPGGAGGASSTENSSTTYDLLDTNEDGVVSAAEQAAASLQAEVKDTKDAASTRTDQTDGSNTANTNGQQHNSLKEEVRQDLLQLAQLAQRQYAAVANNLSDATAQGSTVNLLA